MKKYKIVYWKGGSICVAETEADDIGKARYWFEMCIPHDDLISISEVQE